MWCNPQKEEVGCKTRVTSQSACNRDQWFSIRASFRTIKVFKEGWSNKCPRTMASCLIWNVFGLQTTPRTILKCCCFSTTFFLCLPCTGQRQVWLCRIRRFAAFTTRHEVWQVRVWGHWNLWKSWNGVDWNVFSCFLRVPYLRDTNWPCHCNALDVSIRQTWSLKFEGGGHSVQAIIKI